MTQYAINELDEFTPRMLFSIAVNGQVIPINVSKVTNAIMPQCNNLNFILAIQFHFNFQPIGIRKKPKVIKITIPKCKTKMISEINDIMNYNRNSKEGHCYKLF